MSAVGSVSFVGMLSFDTIYPVAEVMFFFIVLVPVLVLRSELWVVNERLIEEFIRDIRVGAVVVASEGFEEKISGIGLADLAGSLRLLRRFQVLDRIVV